jgi:hypothetical protein
MRQREQLGEATLDVSGTFPGEAIRLLILFVAQHFADAVQANHGRRLAMLFTEDGVYQDGFLEP